MIKIASEWKDYEVLSCGNGEKFERWKDVFLLRPDPQVIWPEDIKKNKNFNKLNACYTRFSGSPQNCETNLWGEEQPHLKRNFAKQNEKKSEVRRGGGIWETKKPFKEEWVCTYKDLKFLVKPMGFKHTGLFPEQAVNWDFLRDLIKKTGREISVLNLFAYTGGASVACAAAGAKVCHVDASKAMTERCKQNAELSGLKNAKIRYIVDDCEKFVQREIKRGNKYDIIIMDPPSYGRGPGGELWKLENNLFPLVKACEQILSENAICFLINSYTTGLQPSVIENILKLALKERNGKFTSYELALPITDSDLVLPCGCSGVATF